MIVFVSLSRFLFDLQLLYCIWALLGSEHVRTFGQNTVQIWNRKRSLTIGIRLADMEFELLDVSIITLLWHEHFTCSEWYNVNVGIVCPVLLVFPPTLQNSSWDPPIAPSKDPSPRILLQGSSMERGSFPKSHVNFLQCRIENPGVNMKDPLPNIATQSLDFL